MRRAVPVILATVGGLALMANLHTHPTDVVVDTVPGAARAATAAPATTAAAPPASGAGSAGGGASGQTPSRNGASTPSTAASPASTTTAAGSSPVAGVQNVDGPVITTPYGDVQVEVTINGRQLLDVKALELPSDRSRSARISQNAGPELRSEALRAQSANIDLVSGASYTSQAYVDSLQGALDQVNH
jgi:uncharacterized protein with FMN-binding domain